MKIIENNSERVRFSSESKPWEKAIGYIISMASLPVVFLGSGPATHGVIGLLIGLFFIMMAYSATNTIFDVKCNTVCSTLDVFGFRIRNIEAPLKSSKLVAMRNKVSGTPATVPNLYLKLSTGGKYRISSFYSANALNIFLKNITKYVPIRHHSL